MKRNLNILDILEMEGFDTSMTLPSYTFQKDHYVMINENFALDESIDNGFIIKLVEAKLTFQGFWKVTFECHPEHYKHNKTVDERLWIGDKDWFEYVHGNRGENEVIVDDFFIGYERCFDVFEGDEILDYSSSAPNIVYKIKYDDYPQIEKILIFKSKLKALNFFSNPENVFVICGIQLIGDETYEDFELTHSTSEGVKIISLGNYFGYTIVYYEGEVANVTFTTYNKGKIKILLSEVELNFI